MLLAAKRMHGGSFQTIGQREDLIMRALAPRAAQHGHATVAVEERREPIDVCARRHRDSLAGQQAGYFRRRRVRSGLKGDIAWNYHDRDTTIAYRLPSRASRDAGHLLGPRAQLTIV